MEVWLILVLIALAVGTVTPHLLESDADRELIISDVILERQRRSVNCGSTHIAKWAESGTIQYLPSSAVNYTVNLNCIWIINSDSPLDISFSRFHTERTLDVLYVRDGVNTSMFLGNVSGTEVLLPNTLRTMKGAYLNFKTDHSVNSSGFALDWKSIFLGKENIKVTPHNLTVLTTERAEFHCEPPTGYPTPVITWKQNGHAIVEDANRVSILTNGKLLVLKDILPSDKGEYVCHASNDADNRSSLPAILDVIGPSEFEVISKESSCFALSPTKRTWNAANKWCEGHNSILAEPRENLRLLQKRITKVELEVTEYWLGRSGIERTTEWTEEGAKIISKNGDSSSCTLYNSTENPGTLSRGNCSDLYHFICQLDRSLCVIPKILKPALKGFTETNLTVSLPTNEDWNYIQVVYVVVFPRFVDGNTSKKWNAEYRAWDAEFSARLKNNSLTGKLFWIARTIEKYDPGMNCVIGDNKKYGEILNKQLEDDMQYYVVLVGHTKLGNFTLYKSGEFGGPFHVTAYKPLDLLQLLAVIGATSFTLCLAMGIYTIIEKYRN